MKFNLTFYRGLKLASRSRSEILGRPIISLFINVFLYRFKLIVLILFERIIISF